MTLVDTVPMGARIEVLADVDLLLNRHAVLHCLWQVWHCID